MKQLVLTFLALCGLAAGQSSTVPPTRTVNGHALSSDVTVSKGDVGLGNVDNTSDANKPVSTATQAALDGKQALLKGVVVTKSNGTRTAYIPSADTDVARGLALESAMAAAVEGDTLDLTPGNYDVAKSTSTIGGEPAQHVILAGMTIRLNGARLYHQASFNGAAIFGAQTVDGWSLMGPGVIEGTAPATSGTREMGINIQSCRRWLICDLTFRYFKNAGIQATNSSYSPTDEYDGWKISTGKITNCNCDLNNIGLAVAPGAEYITMTGCTFNKNLTGCDIYAGNTRFTACEANANVNYGIHLYTGGNHGHGIWSGGSINHNLNFAVHVEANMDYGFTFVGSHFYATTATTNKIQSLGSGVLFSGCAIDSPFYASATASGINYVIGSSFPLVTVSAASAVSDLSAAERLKWVFESNFSLVGGYANNDDRIYSFADNTAALAGGLTSGRHYRNSSTNAFAVVP